MTQQERIAYYEQLMDRVRLAGERLRAALDAFEQVQPAARALDAYYTSADWRRDLEADEAGLLPETLKRGVLSEDGAWNILTENRELLDRLRDFS